MEDTELTRKAIEELMKDMNGYKKMESVPKERKKNPLGKPNKLFLGRTINSILTHNKRESDRTLQKCKRKLKELDEEKRKHKRKHRRAHRGKSESLHEDVGNYDTYENKKHKNMKKNKKRRVKKRRISTSSSSSSSSSSQIESNSSDRSLQHRNLNRKKKSHKANQKQYHEQEFYNENIENTREYYIDPNIAYAAMAYSQINHMMQQQKMLDKEIEERVTILSDISISCYSSSESSLNIILNSSSAEEDENGILTFKLSSGDDETVLKCSQEMNKSVIAVNNNENPFIISEEIDKESVKSYISLDSKDSQKSSKDILLLSSSSDSEQLESKDSQRSAFGDIYLLSSSSDS